MYTGQQFGNYRLTRLIGHGGFADVYLAEHIYLKTQAAVKILTTSLTEEEVAHFCNEARLMMGMDHPHIVRVLDFGMQQKVPFLVMPYAARGSLRGEHPRGEPLKIGQVLPYIQQVTSALYYIHQRKLIHRDVKPENMLVRQDGTIALSDFGIAVIAHSERSLSQQNIGGTGVYMAPELFEGKPRTASDQYALGIVVYEWLSGAPPFQGSLSQLAYQHALTPPRPLREQIPVSPQIEDTILKALAKDPLARFPTVKDFAQALEEASSTAETRKSSLSLPKDLVSPLAPRIPVSFIAPETRIQNRQLISSNQQARQSRELAAPFSGKREPSVTFPHDLSFDTRQAVPGVRKRKRRWLLPFAVILSVILALSGTTFIVETALTKAFFQLPGSGTTDKSASTTATFLNEVIQQKYNQAYGHLSSSLLLVMTEMDFARQAQADDRCYGPVIHYDKIMKSEYTLQGTQNVSYMLTRKKFPHPYTLRFTLQQDPGTGQWLISDYGEQSDLGPAPPTC